MKGDNGTTRLAMGPWSVTLSDETIHLSRAHAARLERLLASYRSIVLPQYRAEYGDNWCSRSCDAPSLVVRIDMQPMAGNRVGLYEIEANPSLLGTMPRLGIDVARPILDAFRILKIDTLQSYVAPSRRPQSADHDAYPTGLVLKPFRSWGTKNMHVCTPLKPWKAMGWTRTRMRDELRRLRAAGRDRDYLVQPFYPPEHRGKRRARIWRIYAVWTDGAYRLVGGFWNERASLRVHGASDACLGALRANGAHHA